MNVRAGSQMLLERGDYSASGARTVAAVAADTRTLSASWWREWREHAFLTRDSATHFLWCGKSRPQNATPSSRRASTLGADSPRPQRLGGGQRTARGGAARQRAEGTQKVKPSCLARSEHGGRSCLHTVHIPLRAIALTSSLGSFASFSEARSFPKSVPTCPHALHRSLLARTIQACTA